MATQLRRDPFMRATLQRILAPSGACAYCGHDGRRFYYYWESDGLHPGRSRHYFTRDYFCGISCWRAFYA